MAKLNFTASQSAAINTRGSSILVSAAAGSGKTRVLTERLMSYVTDKSDPRDIDSFLIITYTRAAAAELRARIMTELMTKSAEEPDNTRLRRQANLCYRAQIGTIHSFCTTVLRENAHSIGLSPDFKIVEEDKATAMKKRCVERLLDKEYDNMDEAFKSLVDTVGAGRDDARLEEIILTLHEKMQSHPNPARYAKEQIEVLRLHGITDVGDTPWGEFLLQKTARSLTFWAAEMEGLVALMHSLPEYAPIAKVYSASVSDTALSIRNLIRAIPQGWDAAFNKLPIEFPRLSGLRNSPNPEISDMVKERREACKKEMGKLSETFTAGSEALLCDMRKMSIAMIRLLELTQKFDKAFSAEKRRQSVVDFSDLEHLAAKLLTDENGAPTLLAQQISERYTEIMVDEYQDVNAVQDMLFHSVSRKGKNLFMVGDVKQAIYRFRLADPGIFLEKYTRFKNHDVAKPDENRKILLRENFRSRAAVLNAANHVFRNIMSTELGELDYNDEAALKCGADYYSKTGELPAELMVVELPEGGEEERPDKARIEALAVAEKINELVRAGTQVKSGDGERPVQYGDIVILMRSPKSVGGIYASTLLEMGIPVADRRGASFFKSEEVSAVLALLAVIDNPYQDVPIISALYSCLFGFTANELAEIRAKNKSGSFYDALKLAAQESERCQKFLDLLYTLREVSGDLPTDELLRRVYNETDVMAIASAMQGGGERRNNLMQLLEYARKFENDGFRGLFKFVAMLRRMTERGEEPRMPSTEGGNAVTIMTIHKSKGLEFPIVFLCDTARKFNKMDTTEAVLIHSELALGPKYTNSERGIEYPTIARRAIAAKQNEELLSEEMRVLYVALTRAKERLFISCAMKKPYEAIEKLRDGLRSPVPPQILEKAQSPAQWLIRTALLPQEYINLSVISPTEETGLGDFGEEKLQKADSTLLETLRERLEYRYPHSEVVSLPSKLTATELKSDSEHDADSDDLVPQKRESVFRLPELGVEKAMTGAERGTAAHIAMQYIDFAKTGSQSEIKAEISRLLARGYLTQRQAEAINVAAIERFFRSEIGQRVLNADEVMRELPFSLLCDAEAYFEHGAGESILLQGVIDCCIVEDSELTIIDYKTDYVNENNISELLSRYAAQIAVYSQALQRISGKPVRERILYFLRGNCAAILGRNGTKAKITRF